MGSILKLWTGLFLSFGVFYMKNKNLLSNFFIPVLKVCKTIMYLIHEVEIILDLIGNSQIA